MAQLTNISAAANRVAADCGKAFQWNRIYLSGLYKRLLDTENQFGEIGKTNYDKLRDFFGESLSEQILSQNIKSIRLIGSICTPAIKCAALTSHKGGGIWQLL